MACGRPGIAGVLNAVFYSAIAIMQTMGLTRAVAVQALRSNGTAGGKLLPYLNKKTDADLAAWENIGDDWGLDVICGYIEGKYEEERGKCCFS
jgi:hypothetical protein